jgi:hypothetical protein
MRCLFLSPRAQAVHDCCIRQAMSSVTAAITHHARHEFATKRTLADVATDHQPRRARLEGRWLP